MIDINGISKVHLSAPLRGLSPPQIASNMRCVLHEGHLLVFATNANDNEHGTAPRVASGATLACVHLHNAITTQKTSTVFEVSVVCVLNNTRKFNDVVVVLV